LTKKRKPTANDIELSLALSVDPNLYRRSSRDKQTIPKTVNGKDVSQAGFREAVVNVVAELETATPGQVAAELGWADTPDRKELIALTMRNMFAQKKPLLVRVKRGLYAIHPKCPIRLGRTLEAGIIDTIRTYGGFATWAEIMSVFDTLPSENEHRLYGGRGNSRAPRIWKAMVESKKIVRYESVEISSLTGMAKPKVMWGLPWSELLKLPVPGRNAEFAMKFEFLNSEFNKGRRGHDGEQELKSNIEEHFSRVGAAFQKVRLMEGIEDVGEVAYFPEIASALEWTLNHLPNGAGTFFAEVRREAERKAAEDGRHGDVQYIEALRDTEAENVLAYVLGAFENGDPIVHRTAPVALYYAYASEFKICPAMLSRGIVMRPLTEVPLPEGCEHLPPSYAPEHQPA
jgi:hypothetical protein